MEKIYKDRTVYVGEINNGYPHGNGSYTNKHGSTYTGQWEYGERSGKGTFTDRDGDTYEGGWKNNKMHGKGICTFANGFSLRMEYKDGMIVKVDGDAVPDGFYNEEDPFMGGHERLMAIYKQRLASTKKNDDETRILIEHAERLVNGDADITYLSGARYVGNIQNGSGYIKQGWGILNYMNGDKYEGYFLNNKRHGEGKYTFRGGRIFNGTWKDNVKITGSFELAICPTCLSHECRCGFKI